MGTQFIDYTNPVVSSTTDTGDVDAPAIKPVLVDEPGIPATFNRPTEVLRVRTELIRNAINELKYVADTDRAYLLSGGGTVTWGGAVDASPAGTGVFITTAPMILRPFTSPGSTLFSKSTKARANVIGDFVVKFTDAGPHGYEGGNEFTLQFVTGGSFSVTVTGNPANDITITVPGATTLGSLSTSINGNATLTALHITSTVTSSGGTLASTLFPLGRIRMLGAVDAEKHVITVAAVSSFFSDPLNILQQGEVVGIYYDTLYDGIGGGRREAVMDYGPYPGTDNTEVGTSGSLFNLRRNPEKAAYCIPLCTVQDDVLIFLNEVAVFRGQPQAGLSAGFVQRAGDTMTGALNTPSLVTDPGLFPTALSALRSTTVGAVFKRYSSTAADITRWISEDVSPTTFASVSNLGVFNINTQVLVNAGAGLNGIRVIGAQSQSAIYGRGGPLVGDVGNGIGVEGLGGSTGPGVKGTGGAVSGSGVLGIGGPNSAGITGVGTGTGAGLEGTAGSSNRGVAALTGDIVSDLGAVSAATTVTGGQGVIAHGQGIISGPGSLPGDGQITAVNMINADGGITAAALGRFNSGLSVMGGGAAVGTLTLPGAGNFTVTGDVHVLNNLDAVSIAASSGISAAVSITAPTISGSTIAASTTFNGGAFNGTTFTASGLGRFNNGLAETAAGLVVGTTTLPGNGNIHATNNVVADALVTSNGNGFVGVNAPYAIGTVGWNTSNSTNYNYSLWNCAWAGSGPTEFVISMTAVGSTPPVVVFNHWLDGGTTINRIVNSSVSLSAGTWYLHFSYQSFSVTAWIALNRTTAPPTSAAFEFVIYLTPLTSGSVA